MKFKNNLIITLVVVAVVAAVMLAALLVPARPDQVARVKRIQNDARLVASACFSRMVENAKDKCSLADIRIFMDAAAPEFPDLHRWLSLHCHLPDSCPWPRGENTARQIRVAAWSDGHAVSDYMSAVDARATGLILAERGFFALRVAGLDRRAANVPAGFRAQLQPESDVVVFEAATGSPAAPAATKPPGQP